MIIKIISIVIKIMQKKKKEEEKLNIEQHNKRFLLQFTNRNCNATSISKLYGKHRANRSP